MLDLLVFVGAIHNLAQGSTTATLMMPSVNPALLNTVVHNQPTRIDEVDRQVFHTWPGEGGTHSF